jgi:hypothetical protein
MIIILNVPTPTPISVWHSAIYLHQDRALAYRHAGFLEAMTGDRCRVVKHGLMGYRVARFDPGGGEAE